MANEAKRVVAGGVFGVGNKATGMRLEYHDGTAEERSFETPVSEAEGSTRFLRELLRNQSDEERVEAALLQMQSGFCAVWIAIHVGRALATYAPGTNP